VTFSIGVWSLCDS